MSLISKSEFVLYIKVLVFGLVMYALLHFYTTKMGIPNVMNKSFADASIILIALSMWLSSLAYFFNIFDPLIKYRKHLGLVGFALGVVHIFLSLPALKGLPNPAPLTGVLATVIFTVMTIISNRFMMMKIGIVRWRSILQTGYIAVILVWAHVVFLKYGRWMTWYEGGMKTLPSTSLMIAIFLIIVVLMRVVMWLRIRK